MHTLEAWRKEVVFQGPLETGFLFFEGTQPRRTVFLGFTKQEYAFISKSKQANKSEETPASGWRASKMLLGVVDSNTDYHWLGIVSKILVTSTSSLRAYYVSSIVLDMGNIKIISKTKSLSEKVRQTHAPIIIIRASRNTWFPSNPDIGFFV